MKVLIWIFTFIIGSIVNTLIGMAIGIRAGSILLYIVEFYIAKNLCQKWDEHMQDKNRNDHSTVSSPVANDTDEPLITAPHVPVVEKSVPLPEENSSAVRFCRKCGAKLVDNAQFCRKCGTAVIVVEEKHVVIMRDNEVW